MTYLGRLLAILMLSIAASPVFAADPVYPPGVRVGIVPIAGLVPAQGFVGFETADHGVKVLMTELPAAAYKEVESAVAAGLNKPDAAKPEPIDTSAGKGFYTSETAKAGADDVRRYSMIVPADSFSGYVAVQVPANADTAYSDKAVRNMLATAVVRNEVPVDEQLGLLPFKLTELSAFKTVRTLAPGAVIMLGDFTTEARIETSPFMIIGTIAASPDRPEDRGRFAQQAAAQIPGLRDGRITLSEPMRIEGSPGYETRIEATSGNDNTPVTVVQWLRFGGAKTALRIIASAPRDQWPEAFPRFRAVRDGIQAR